MENLQIKRAHFFPHEQLRRVLGDGLIKKERIIRKLLYGEVTFRFYSRDLAIEISEAVGGSIKEYKYPVCFEVIP